jgi:hypothetical protein
MTMILLLLFVITCMQGIYIMSETKRFSSVYTYVAAMLWLQFMLHVILFPMLNVLYFYFLIIIIIIIIYHHHHHHHHRLCYLLTVGAMFVQWSCQRLSPI